MKNILITRSGGMGDIIFITPALSIIRRNFPEAKISTLIPSSWVDILKGNKDVDQIIENPYRSFFKAASLLSALKSYNFDLLINFDPRKEYDYKIWAYELKIGSVWSLIDKNSLPIDFKKYNFKNFVWHIWDTKKHHVENYLALLQEAGLRVDSKEFKITINKQDDDFVVKLLLNYNISGKDLLIGFHPGIASSNCATLGILLAKIKSILKARLPIERRRWPLRYYAELANLLSKEFKCKIIITGSDCETRLAKRISRLMNFEAINLSGKTTIRELAALYNRCDLVVGSDTGPIHLAAAIGTFVVGLYGYTNCLHSGPWAEASHFKVVQSNLDCSPCQHIRRKKICWCPACMEQIKPEAVFQEIKAMINNLHANGRYERK